MKQEAPSLEQVQYVLTECLHSADFMIEREFSAITSI